MLWWTSSTPAARNDAGVFEETCFNKAMENDDKTMRGSSPR